jgi:hypothetical protein
MSRTRILSYGVIAGGLIFSGNNSVDAATTTGITLGYTAGYDMVNSVRNTIAAGTIVLTDDATNWVYSTGSGILANAGAAPTDARVLYKVTTVSAAITAIVDYRSAIVTDATSFP